MQTKISSNTIAFACQGKYAVRYLTEVFEAKNIWGLHSDETEKGLYYYCDNRNKLIRMASKEYLKKIYPTTIFVKALPLTFAEFTKKLQNYYNQRIKFTSNKVKKHGKNLHSGICARAADQTITAGSFHYAEHSTARTGGKLQV